MVYDKVGVSFHLWVHCYVDVHIDGPFVTIDIFDCLYNIATILSSGKVVYNWLHSVEN